MDITLTIPDRDADRICGIVKRAAGTVPDNLDGAEMVASFLADHLARTVANVEHSDAEAARPPAEEPPSIEVTPEPITAQVEAERVRKEADEDATPVRSR